MHEGHDHDHNHDHDHCHCHTDHHHTHSHEDQHLHGHAHTHTHDGSTHEHTHAHSHSHAHSEAHTHEHTDEELHIADKQMQTLYALLDHWVDHNISHQEGFKEWAAKAQAAGKNEAAELILKAVTVMDVANIALREAKKSM